MSTTMDARCYACDPSTDDKSLRRCPICHKNFCEEHTVVMSGRPFCSKGCADFFFFAEPDD